MPQDPRPVHRPADHLRRADEDAVPEARHQDAHPGPVKHGAVTVQYPHEKRGAGTAGTRRHRPQGGELHRLHALLAQLPRLVHLHRGPQDQGSAPPTRAARSARSARSTASTSTTRSACTAASAWRSARSTPSSGAPSTSTRSPAWPTCSTTRSASTSGWRPSPTSSPTRRGSRPRSARCRASMVAQNIFFYAIAAVIVYSAFRVVTTNNVVHAALYLVAVLAARGRAVHPAGRRVRRRHPGARLHRRHRGAVPLRHHAHPRQARRATRTSPTSTGWAARPPPSSCSA